MGTSGFVEREAEQHALAAALDAAARSAGGSAVLVLGAAGIGKTELFAWCRREAVRRGMTTLAARASDIEADHPFALARRLLGGGAERIPSGGDPVAELVQLTLDLASRESSGLLVAVDDLHASDRDSIRFLALLVGSIDVARMAVVLTADPGVVGAHEDLFARLAGADTLSVLQPAPLTEEGVGRLLADEIGDPATLDGIEALAGAVHEVTGGNPFLVRELVSAVQPSRHPDREDLVERVRTTVPDQVVRAVRARLVALGPPAHQLARAVAVLGPDAGVGDAGELAELSLNTTVAAAERLIDAGLLQDELQLTFRHPLVGSAVLCDLGSFALANMHRRAAAVLRARGDTSSRIEEHLLESAPAADAEVVRTLRDAAAAASRQGALDRAILLLRRALLEPPDAEQRSGVVLELARVEAEAGEPAAVERFLQGLDLVSDVTERLAALRELSRLHFIRERHLEAAATITRAMAEVDENSPLAAELLAEYIAAVSFGAAVVDPATRAVYDQRVAALLQRHAEGTLPDHPALTLQVASILAVARGRRSAVESLMVQTLAHGPLDDLPPYGFASTWAVMTLVAVDALDLAMEVSAAAHRPAQRNGSVLQLGNAVFSIATVCAAAGQLRRAEQECSRSLRLAQAGVTSTLVWSAALLATVRRQAGDLTGARRAIAAAQHTDPNGMTYGILLHHSAMLALAEGDPDRASSEALRARDHLGEYQLTDYPLAPWRLVAGVAAHALERRDEGMDLVQQELALARRANTPSSIGHALLGLARISEPDDRLPLLEESVSVLTESGAQLLRAHAMAELGLARLNGQERESARELLLDAFDLARSCGAAPLRRRVRAGLHALETRPRPAAAQGTVLTSAERRTAELAGRGLSNREIAEVLHLTTSTIEFHLTRVYRKLGIRSREQLKGLSLNET
jgi:DNA-binding CsgD family transcriptional regulator